MAGAAKTTESASICTTGCCGARAGAAAAKSEIPVAGLTISAAGKMSCKARYCGWSSPDRCSRAVIRLSSSSRRVMRRSRTDTSSSREPFIHSLLFCSFCSVFVQRGPSSVAGVGGVGQKPLFLFRPWRQDFYQYPQNENWQEHQHNGRSQPFPCPQAHLVSRVSEETLGE